MEDRQSLTATFADLIDRYYAMVQYDPAMRDIWSGTQADKQLMRDQIFASAMVTPRREGEPAKVRVATDALKSES